MRAIHQIQIIAVLGILFLASCSTEQAVFTAPEAADERIDMIIDGNQTESIFVQNENLLDYTFYGYGASQLDIRVDIGNDRTLVFKLTDETSTDLWENETGYSIYATNELEDKQKYVIVELEVGDEIPAYRTHIGNNFPRNTYVNAFNVIDFDPASGEILCRIIDLPMASVSSDEELSINGTFRGAVDFLN